MARPHEAGLEGHTPDAIAERLSQGPEQTYLRDFVFGAVDGTVTTFAIVAGVAGAQLSAGIVVVLGVANLLGDGFSMAVGNYLGTRAEDQLRQRYRKIEAEHIDEFPEGEREEIRQIFSSKGFEGMDLERAVAVVTSERQRWIDTMLTEEWGLSLTGPSPTRAAWMTFVAFVMVGAVPLIPFVADLAGLWPRAWNVFGSSATSAGVAFFAIGAAKSRFVGHTWWHAGLETLALGGAASTLAYVVGALLKGIL